MLCTCFYAHTWSFTHMDIHTQMHTHTHTMLHSKRIDLYHTVVFAVFLGESCMYPHMT